MFVCAECGASQPMPGHCGADGSPLAPSGEDLLLGQTIGAYRIARLIGIGGMGRVYKGVHPQIGSRVAIKVLSRECSDRRDLVERFFAEAKAVNLIRHESIVNVLDLATLPDGRPYIVMEYLDGSPLASIIEHAQRSGQRLPLGGVARLIAEVLDALGAAHTKGIVHRDLKPDNIYVTPAGRAKVLDFGIAKLQPELGGRATHTGSLLGTPHYMSPEQANARPVDARADLYALGVILFECGTGQRPFYADSLFDLLRKHVEQPPPSPRAQRPDMPEGLEQVIYVALAKAPEQRFASAQAMSMALQHATASLPPDQWAPIQPSNVSRPPAGGWAPTPPASWAGNARPATAVAPTQTAGQVTGPTKPASSRKALWIALAGVLLVGGGITAAVLAGGGSGKTVASTETGSGSGSQVALVDVPADAPIAVIPDEVPAPVPAANDELSPEQAEALDDVLEQMIGSNPLAAGALGPEINAALKKYGGWSKIPKAQRMKLLAGLQGSLMGGDVGNAVADALSTDDPEGPGVAPARPTAKAVAPAPPAQPAPPAPPAQPATVAGAWITYSNISLPGASDLSKLDIAAVTRAAVAEAKRRIPDAVLFRIDADGVSPKGIANLTAVDGSLDFRFVSPSRAKDDPNRPIGGKKPEAKCMFRIMISDAGTAISPMTGFDCAGEALIGMPKCTFVQIWQRAIKGGATSNAFAEIGYRAWDNKPRWYFNINDERAKSSQMFEDDCR